MLHRVWDSALALLLAVHALGLVGRVVAWPQQHKPRFEVRVLRTQALHVVEAVPVGAVLECSSCA